MPSPSSSSTYTMEDLTALAGVTARTVRYYIAEGLLPPPNGAGPATTYGEVHRNRLHLIGILKDAYLPLKEIRRRLAAMSEQEIADAIAERLTPHDESSSEPPQRRSHRAQEPERQTSTPASATAYIDHVLESQRPTQRRGASRSHPVSAPMPASMPAPMSSPGDRPDAAASWKRLSITPEAELLIEQEAYRRRQEQVDAALDWLRRILNGS